MPLILPPPSRRGWIYFVLIAVSLLSPPAYAKSVDGIVIYVTLDEVYVDIGSEAGLRSGDTGTVFRQDQKLARVSVWEATQNSARLRVVSRLRSDPVQIGDKIVMEASFQPLQNEPPPQTPSPGPLPAVKKKTGFVPLLSSPEETVVTRARNISNGRLRIRNLHQNDSSGASDYSLTRLETNGDFQRINGSDWSFLWDGNLSYRDGSAFVGSNDYREVRSDIYRAMIQGPVGKRYFFRMGRFVPTELPGLGYIDGVHLENNAKKKMTWGAMAGVRPDRKTQNLSSDEPVASLYATVESGARRKIYYSETIGLLGTMYKGEFDRLALLHDQRVNVGSRLSLYSTLQADFDVHQSTLQSGVLLSRFDAYATYRVASFLSIQAGADRYRRPLTNAERDQFQGSDQLFLNPGYWRYWGGSSQNLPWKLRFDEEISYYDNQGDEYEPQWRVGVTRTGLPFFPRSPLNVSVYNLSGAGLEGLGGVASTYLPFMKNRLTLSPSCRFRYVSWVNREENKDLSLTDWSVRGDWLPNKTIGFSLGVTQTFNEVSHALLVDASVDYRW